MAEIKNIVEEAAVRGSFSTKMNMEGKAGYTKELSELLNQLSDVTGDAMNDITRVATALANGDLTQKITKDYPGLFGQTAQGVNGTVQALSEIVNDIQFIALSAGQGDFSTKMNMNGKAGLQQDPVRADEPALRCDRSRLDGHHPCCQGTGGRRLDPDHHQGLSRPVRHDQAGHQYHGGKSEKTGDGNQELGRCHQHRLQGNRRGQQPTCRSAPKSRPPAWKKPPPAWKS